MKAVSGGEGVPSLAPDIIEGGASLLGLGEEAASGNGLGKLVLDAALTAGSGAYCVVAKW